MAENKYYVALPCFQVMERRQYPLVDRVFCDLKTQVDAEQTAQALNRNEIFGELVEEVVYALDLAASIIRVGDSLKLEPTKAMAARIAKLTDLIQKAKAL